MEKFRDNSRKMSIASMTEEKRLKEVEALVSRRRECDFEIERILGELAAQCGASELVKREK